MTDAELAANRADRGLLIEAMKLAGAEQVRATNAWKCPFHDDKHPSASVYEKDGVWKFKCHACKINEDYIGVLARKDGRSSADVLRSMAPKNGNGHREKPRQVFATPEAMARSVLNYKKHWCYTNPVTKLVDMVTVRSECGDDKRFVMGRPR